jgi:hypothetical protein
MDGLSQPVVPAAMCHAEPLQQRVLEALLACHPATLTAAALTKRCGDWMRKPKVGRFSSDHACLMVMHVSPHPLYAAV